MPKTRSANTNEKQQLYQARINELASQLKLNGSCLKTNYIQGSLNGDYLAPEQFPEMNYPIKFYCSCCETGIKSEGELRKHIVTDKHKHERQKKDYVSQLEIENKSLKKKLLKYECASVDDFIKECDECDFIFESNSRDIHEIYCKHSPIFFDEFFFHFKVWCKSQGSKSPNKEQVKDEMMEWQRHSQWGLSITSVDKESFYFRNGSYNNFRVNVKPKVILKKYDRELDESNEPYKLNGWIGED